MGNTAAQLKKSKQYLSIYFLCLVWERAFIVYSSSKTVPSLFSMLIGLLLSLFTPKPPIPRFAIEFLLVLLIDYNYSPQVLLGDDLKKVSATIYSVTLFCADPERQCSSPFGVFYFEPSVFRFRTVRSYCLQESLIGSLCWQKPVAAIEDLWCRESWQSWNQSKVSCCTDCQLQRMSALCSDSSSQPLQSTHSIIT